MQPRRHYITSSCARRAAALGHMLPVAFAVASGLAISILAFVLMRGWDAELIHANVEHRVGGLVTFLQDAESQTFTRQSIGVLDEMRRAHYESPGFEEELYERFGSKGLYTPALAASPQWITVAKDGPTTGSGRSGRGAAVAGPRYQARTILAGENGSTETLAEVPPDEYQARVLAWSRDTGLASIYGRVPVNAELEKEMTFRIAMPAYKSEFPPVSAEQRNASLDGYVSMLVQVFLTGRSAHFTDVSGGVTLLLFEIGPSRRGVQAPDNLRQYVAGDSAEGIDRALIWHRPIDFAGKRWVVAAHAHPELFAARRSKRPWVALAGGLFATLLLTVYLVRPAGRAARIARVVADRTEQLSLANGALERQMADLKRAEDALRARYEFEKLVTTISTRFMNLASDELDSAVNEALRMIGEFEGDDRCYIFLFSQNGARIEFRYEWRAEGIESVFDRYSALPAERFGWWVAQLRASKAIHLPSLDALPPAAASERELLSGGPLKSLVCVPMACGGALIGFLGFARTREHKAWSEESISLLKIVGEIFANALERKRAEEALRRSEEKYRALIENMEDGFYEVDLRGNYIYANPALASLLGKLSEEMIGVSYRATMDEANARTVYQLFHQVFVTGRPVRDFVWELSAASGKRTRVEGSVSLVRTHEGRPCGFQGVLRDITERLAAEEERTRLEEQLQQAQKLEAIGRLAGGVAHDFNNLLAGILGYANLLKEESEAGSKVRKAADVIEKAADRAAELTRQLLGFARKGKHQNVPVDLHASIHEVVALLSHTIDKRIRITQRAKAPSATILGDPSQMQQVVLNLAINARDAMPEGGELLFETSETVLEAPSDPSDPEAVPPGRYLALSVADTGAGIPEAVREHIFEPFFTTKEMGKGTGMGLAMVYGIVRNHGGTIHLRTEEGKGSRFIVYLPLAAQAPAGLPPDATQAGRKPIEGRGRILVVDDEEVVREMAADMLRAMGYDVVTAPDGEDAIEYYAERAAEIDLALIDMVMPKMGGKECFRELKRINPGIRAVLSTGYGRDGAAQEILNEGMAGFAQKPYRMRELGEIIAAALL